MSFYNHRVGEGAEDEDEQSQDSVKQALEYQDVTEPDKPRYGNIDKSIPTNSTNLTNQSEGANTRNVETSDGGVNGYVNPTMEQTSFGTTTIPMHDVLNQSNFIGKYLYSTLY